METYEVRSNEELRTREVESVREVESRSIGVDGVEVVTKSEVKEVKRFIEGYALVFNRKSEPMWGFREVILPEVAQDDVLLRSTVVACYNHGRGGGVVMARSKNGQGTLSLNWDERGLFYSFEVSGRSAEEVYEAIKRGDLDKSSFRFTLPEGGAGERWIKQNDGNYLREIVKFERLYDVSPVDFPAYESSSCKVGKRERVSDNNYQERLKKLGL